jgi:hypothetical protein
MDMPTPARRTRAQGRRQGSGAWEPAGEVLGIRPETDHLGDGSVDGRLEMGAFHTTSVTTILACRTRSAPSGVILAGHTTDLIAGSEVEFEEGATLNSSVRQGAGDPFSVPLPRRLRGRSG